MFRTPSLTLMFVALLATPLLVGAAPATLTQTQETVYSARGFVPQFYGSQRSDCLAPYHNFTNGTQDNRSWEKVVLENDWIRVDVLPQVGGRVFRFVNKTTGSNQMFENPAGFKRNDWGRMGWSAAGGSELMMPRDEHAGPFYHFFNYTTENYAGGVRITMVIDEDDLYNQVNRGFKLTVVVTVPDNAAYYTVDHRLENKRNQQQFMEFWTNSMVSPGPGNMRYNPRTNANQHIIYPRNVTQVFNHNDNGNPNDVFGNRWGVLNWPVHSGVNISRFDSFLNGNHGYMGVFVAGQVPVNFGGIYNVTANEGIVKTFPSQIRGGTRSGLKYWHWGNASGLAGLYGNGTDTYMEMMTGPSTVFQEPANCDTGPHPFVNENYGHFMNAGEVLEWRETYITPHGIGDVVHVHDKCVLNFAAPAGAACGNQISLTLGAFPTTPQTYAHVLVDIGGSPIFQQTNVAMGPGSGAQAPYYNTPNLTLNGVTTGSHQIRMRVLLEDGTEVSYQQPFNVTGGACGPTNTPASYDTPTPTNTPTVTPTFTPTLVDTDQDGLPDNMEAWPFVAGITNRYLHDSDGDGLIDGVEDANKSGSVSPGETNPLNPDSDGDGLIDGVEVRIGTNPLDANSPETYTDFDNDGLPAPHDIFDNLPDSDGDRFKDGYEAAALGMSAVLNAGVRPPLADANQDGEVTNLDALIVQALFLNILSPGDPVFAGLGFRNTDLNFDGAVTNLDALIIQAFFLNAIPMLPM